MIDFNKFPKQWFITSSDPGKFVGGKRDRFDGWYIATAAAVPVLRLCHPDGSECGRLIGWVIDGQHLHLGDAKLHLGQQETPDALYNRLAGRFVMLWRDEEGIPRLREDASGGLPAIYVPGMRMIGATVTLLDQLQTLPVDRDIEDIFNFPARRGFLPFGLTPRLGAYRLMPSHELELGGFGARRFWPEAPLVRIDPDELPGHARKMASVLREQVLAVLSHGETSLLLSGGRDSRIVLAAARGRTGALRTETLGDSRVRDVFIAGKVAKAAGVPHRQLSVLPCPDQELSDWLDRSGHMMFDPVSRLGPTVRANDTGAVSISGTGAEIMRASNWDTADVSTEKLDLQRLLEKIRMPGHPRLQHAAQDWLDGLPNIDAPLTLDLAKIEQIHGCWSGAAVYGHDQQRPSVLPFSGRRLYDLALTVPMADRQHGTFYNAVMAELWPELASIPANRVTGLERFRFWREEVRDIVPDSVKRMIKPLR